MTSVRQSLAESLPPVGRIVLAVSGGLDSMVLLDGAAHVVDRDRLIVATYDHGTGKAARAAARLVGARARTLGLKCRAERTSATLSGEASFRKARWVFLRRVAGEEEAAVCTAHTADDQVETVLMRILRDAGARGVAALEADTGVLRPLLAHTRHDVATYARARRLEWVEDPSNASGRYLRNRLRHDLLPALRRVRPSIDADLLAIGRQAAQWRSEVEALVERQIPVKVHPDGASLDIAAESIAGRSTGALRVLWPAILSRVGLTLDRRGTERLAEFVARGRVGSRVQVSGGWEVTRARRRFELRRLERLGDAGVCPLSCGSTFGGWTFRSVGTPTDISNLWSASLPGGTILSVRSWRAGDTMVGQRGREPRTVKHYLSRAGVTGTARRGWPVVLAGDEIVWIPGVRRSETATARSGQPGLPFVCEYLSR